MKKILSLILLIAAGLCVDAQTLSEQMESAVEICQNLSMAISTSSTAQLKAANKSFKAANLVEFGFLRHEKGNELDINGHFLFDEDFIDSLIVNRKIIEYSKKYAQKRAQRGSQGVSGRIQLTTKALKAGEKSVWKTVNRDVAEYALVAEPGGLFTMTIRDVDGKLLYTETENNKKGASVRKAHMKLPSNKRTTLLIEIVNRGKNDASFALLGN